METQARLSIDEATTLCRHAALRNGALPETAQSIAAAVVDAETEGKPSVGLAHFLDYLDGLACGRIEGTAEPVISRPAGALILSDAQGGAAHPGFDRCFDDIVTTASALGIALFSQRNAFTCGALGFFARRLAERRLVALAFTNGPALMAGAGGTRPVFCTNPLAFAAPIDGSAPLVIDQASSATAFVKIREAVEAGTPLPQGWALDADGQATTDPLKAMSGALLAFGGTRGANIALMVEVLSAGLAGANWSLDAPSFSQGSQSPGSGITVIAIAAALIDPDFSKRLGAQIDRLAGDYNVHIPGLSGAKARDTALRDGLMVDRALVERIAAYGRKPAP